MSLKKMSLLLIVFLFSGCLKTRSEVGEDEQSQIYTRKNATNQHAQQESQRDSQLNTKTSAQSSEPIDERDELIRSLNGRVENLENQIKESHKEKSASTEQDNQKVQILQEALTKMEAQIQKLEAEQAQKAASEQMAAASKSSDESEVKSSKKNGHTKDSDKSANSYELAQGFFASKDWKKAILNYQKYVDRFPKGKEVADSKYKIGVCFQELGMKEESMAFYEEVVANFSKTDAGKKAKIRLAKLKK